MKIYVDTEISRELTFPGIKEDRYIITNFGRIVDKMTGKFKLQHDDKDGYKHVSLTNDKNKQVTRRVHRLVAWEYCHYKRDLDLVINHKDACKYNNYYKNLEWVTISENTLHGYDYGQAKSGAEHYRNTYPASMIHRICKMLEDNKSNIMIFVSLEEKYYDIVSHKTKKKIRGLIKDVRRKKVWRSIYRQYNF